MNRTQQIKTYRVFGKTDKGLVRNENQDAFSYFESVNGGVFVLCDGMGGLPGGKEAAETAIRAVESFVSDDWFENEKVLIQKSFDFANSQVRDKLGHASLNIYSGTTLVLTLIRNNKVYYAHAGDSRIYYKTGKKLFLLTEDHSLVAKLIKEKKITAEEAQNHDKKNIIWNAVGIKENVVSEICKKPIIPADNDILLMCSDGLTNELSDNEINNVLEKHKNIEDAGTVLIKKALKKGGKDNVTVQLIQFFNTEKKTGTYKPSKKKNRKKRLIRIAAVIFIFLLINAWFMFNYFFVNNDIKRQKNTAFRSVSNDLFQKSNSKKYKTYSVGKNIYAYPDVNNIIQILKQNNKKEFYFYPAEEIKLNKDK